VTAFHAGFAATTVFFAAANAGVAERETMMSESTRSFFIAGAVLMDPIQVFYVVWTITTTHTAPRRNRTTIEFGFGL
jgi:rhamnogalacturonyl hydrolase YesR